jgi:hypothetical protein
MRSTPVSDVSERFVPKVHPASRPAEADDPYLLHATPVAGDVEVMLECIATEYAWLGCNADQLMELFRDPGYPLLNAVLHHYGADALRQRLGSVLRRMGVFHVSGSISDAPEPADEEPDLVQLGILARPRAGENHGQGV